MILIVYLLTMFHFWFVPIIFYQARDVPVFLFSVSLLFHVSLLFLKWGSMMPLYRYHLFLFLECLNICLILIQLFLSIFRLKAHCPIIALTGDIFYKVHYTALSTKFNFSIIMLPPIYLHCFYLCQGNFLIDQVYLYDKIIYPFLHLYSSIFLCNIIWSI